MRHLQFIFKRKAGSWLIQDDFLGLDWLRAIQAVNNPSLRSPTKLHVCIVGTVLPHAIMRDGCIRVEFEVVEKIWWYPFHCENPSFTERWKNTSARSEGRALKHHTGTDNWHSNRFWEQKTQQNRRVAFSKHLHYLSCTQLPTTHTHGKGNDSTTAIRKRSTSHKGSRRTSSGSIPS